MTAGGRRHGLNDSGEAESMPVRLSAKQHAWLDAKALKEGISKAELIRRMIQERMDAKAKAAPCQPIK